MQEKDTGSQNVLTQEELIKAIQANDEVILKNSIKKTITKQKSTSSEIVVP